MIESNLCFRKITQEAMWKVDLGGGEIRVRRTSRMAAAGISVGDDKLQ